MMTTPNDNDISEDLLQIMRELQESNTKIADTLAATQSIPVPNQDHQKASHADTADATGVRVGSSGAFDPNATAVLELSDKKAVESLTDAVGKLTAALEKVSGDDIQPISYDREYLPTPARRHTDDPDSIYYKPKYGNGHTNYNSHGAFVYSDDAINAPLHQQKGFAAAVRRGILDRNNELPAENSLSGKIGKTLGKGISMFSSMDAVEKKLHAKNITGMALSYERAMGNRGAEELSSFEQEHLTHVRSDVMTGHVDTKGLTPDEYMEKYRKELIEKNNEIALRTHAPDEWKKRYKNDSGNTEHHNTTVTTAPVTPPPVVTDDLSLVPNAATLDGGLNTKEDALRILTPAANDDGETAILPDPAKGTAKKKKKDINPDAKQDEYNTPKHDTGPIAVEFPKKVIVDTFDITTLSIGKLILPDDAFGGGSKDTPDVDIPDLPDRSRTRGRGKMGRLRQFGRAALPIAIGAAPLLALHAASQSAEKADIDNPNDGSMFGAIGRFGKSLSQSLGNLFGLPSDKAELDKIKSGIQDRGVTYTAAEAANIKSKYGYDVPTSAISQVTTSERLDAVKNAAPGELAAATGVKTQLETEEKLAASKSINSTPSQSPVIVNAPTNVVAGGGKEPGITGAAPVRPTYNAFERFIERTFSAL